MGVPKGWDARRDPDFLAIRTSLFPVAPKRLGVAFDAVVSEPASNSFPLEDIRAAGDRLRGWRARSHGQ
jgi:hypothetical protein